MLENPILCVVFTLVMFCLFAAIHLWIDDRKREIRHKRIINVRGLNNGRIR